MTEKVTVPKLMKMKREGKKITMVTAYDYPTAMIADTKKIASRMISIKQTSNSCMIAAIHPQTVNITIK